MSIPAPRSLLSLAALAALAACGGPEEQAGLALHERAGQAFTASSVDTRPGVLPPVVEFRHLDHEKPLVPSYKVASHFVNQIAASPEDKTHFRAYGVDAVTKVVYYHIDGDTRRDLGHFLGLVDKQIVQNGLAAQGAGLQYSWGSTGQILVGTKPDPTPPVPGGLPQASVPVLIDLAITVQVAIKGSLAAVVR